SLDTAGQSSALRRSAMSSAGIYFIDFALTASASVFKTSTIVTHGPVQAHFGSCGRIKTVPWLSSLSPPRRWRVAAKQLARELGRQYDQFSGHGRIGRQCQQFKSRPNSYN